MKLIKLAAILCLLILSINIQAKTTLEINVQQLETQGFTIVDNVFSPAELKELADNYQVLKNQALNIVQTTTPKPRVFSENNKTNNSQYWKSNDQVILQAGKGRYDLYKGFQKGIFASDTVLHNKVLEQLMTKVMLDEFTSYSGIIHSGIGSEDQYWHRDTHTMTNTGTDGSKLITMDDFYFTILVPITVPFTVDNGTTEFMVGSHRMPAEDFAKCQTLQSYVPLGSALVFNGKINHRGKANNSAADRPALYLVYHKSWYNDQYRRGVD